MLLLSTQQDQHVAQSSDDHFSFLHKIIILYLNSHLIRSVQKKKKKKKKKNSQDEIVNIFSNSC